MLFGKKKKPGNTPETPVNTENTENSEVQFEKNIKVLWIYTTLFCLFALALIVVSSIIQGKMNSRAEYYQEQFENAQTSGQSALKNIQDENAALKHDIEMYKTEYEKCKAELDQDKQLLINATELIENAQMLLKCQNELFSGSYSEARELFKGIDPGMLSEDMQNIYEDLSTRLGE